MTRLEFNELVESLAERYQGRPRSLVWATGIWLAAGYLLFFSGLLLGLVAGLAMIAGGLWLAHHAAAWLVAGGVLLLLAVCGIYGRFIWTPRGPNYEVILKPGDAPALEALIEDMRQAVGCRPFHRVIFSSSLNAGVANVPRFGLLGGVRKVLMLGLPLMEVCSPEEFRAVLAHEFVHHSRNHGRFSMWVYRVRDTWQKVYEDLESGKWQSGLTMARKFLQFFWPRMNARAFLVCREQEYAADRFAADAVGAKVAASALWRIETYDRYLDTVFWPLTQRSAELAPEPPPDIVARLLPSLAAAPDSSVGDWCVRSTLARVTDTADTHPSFADRTSAIGEDPSQLARAGWLPLPNPNAAEAYLQSARERLAGEVSRVWLNAVRDAWRAQHRRLSGLRRRLQQILTLAETKSDDLSLATERARLVHELDGPEAVRPVLEQLFRAHPGHRATAFELGRVALSLGDAAGIDLLAEIIDHQRDSFYVPACTALVEFFRLTGRVGAMREMEARLDGRDAWAEWLRGGHRRLATDARWLPHGLTTEQLEAVTTVLRGERQLAAAWLSRAESQLPGSPALFILCVSGGFSLLPFRRGAAEHAMRQQLIARITLPGRLLVISRNGANRELARRIVAIPDAQIFP